MYFILLQVGTRVKKNFYQKKYIFLFIFSTFTFFMHQTKIQSKVHDYDYLQVKLNKPSTFNVVIDFYINFESVIWSLRSVLLHFILFL